MYLKIIYYLYILSMSKDTSEKKHNMKTRKDIKIKDGDIDYTKEFDIDKEDTNSVTLTETTEETTEDTTEDTIDDISVSDSLSEKNSNIDDEETEPEDEEMNDKVLKRKFNDILNSDNTIIILNNNDKRSKKLFNGLTTKFANKIDEDEAEEVDDEELEEDPDYFNEYAEYDEEDPYSSIKEDFEKEIEKATELIKKNEDVIKDNPNFKNYSRQDVEYFLN